MPLTFDVEHARAFLRELGAADEVVDFRAIHDSDRSVAGVNLRGTLDQCAAWIQNWNNAGYGIFFMVNRTDGAGRSNENVAEIRAQFIDVDYDPEWHKWRAVAEWLPPTVYVVSSPGKFHAYWPTERHTDRARYETIQRKLVTKWDSDRQCVDPARVMRLPGTWHLKDVRQPHQVRATIWRGGVTIAPGVLEWQLASVEAANVAERIELGDPALLAPDPALAVEALERLDPVQMDRAEWLKVTAAFKAAAWQLGEAIIRQTWEAWCARYPDNDRGENEKLWSSIITTKAGWPYLAKVSGLGVELMFRGGSRALPVGAQAPASAPVVPPMPANTPGAGEALGSFLTPQEQAQFFAGCVFVQSMGRIMVPSGRLMDQTKFNGSFGGKQFMLDADGQKTTDEPWKAATRGQVFRVQQADHLRFVPSRAPGELIPDAFGRLGLNTWKPANVRMVEGDASPFVSHLRAMIANEDDLRILLNFMAHCVQRPGHKAFWAPVIQSTEGAGKSLIAEALSYAIGDVYVYSVNAKELGDGGGKFNAWLRSRLLIIANEIRVDDKRDMLEVLKPLITESRIEIQGKGQDQEVEDNAANWIMFTNYKDAVPVTRDSRRYAIFYSPFQNADDLRAAGMSGEYFPKLFGWLRSGGNAHVAWFLKNFPIDPELDPAGAAHRAPATSSVAEAIAMSLGRAEQLIVEACGEGAAGFRGGWLSSVMVNKLLDENRVRMGPHALQRMYQTLGYHQIGRAPRAYMQEDGKQPNLYHLQKDAKVSDYAKMQNYEP